MQNYNLSFPVTCDFTCFLYKKLIVRSCIYKHLTAQAYAIAIKK